MLAAVAVEAAAAAAAASVARLEAAEGVAVALDASEAGLGDQAEMEGPTALDEAVVAASDDLASSRLDASAAFRIKPSINKFVYTATIFFQTC